MRSTSSAAGGTAGGRAWRVRRGRFGALAARCVVFTDFTAARLGRIGVVVLRAVFFFAAFLTALIFFGPTAFLARCGAAFFAADLVVFLAFFAVFLGAFFFAMWLPRQQGEVLDAALRCRVNPARRRATGPDYALRTET
ncbi:MAG: hypothetical protein IPM18_00345 [Phycisphaerales bacterium]|nr:hypothetical protein [Phycisphaerales bacterium]